MDNTGYPNFREHAETRSTDEMEADPLYRALRSQMADIVSNPPLGRPLYESLAKLAYAFIQHDRDRRTRLLETVKGE